MLMSVVVVLTCITASALLQLHQLRHRLRRERIHTVLVGYRNPFYNQPDSDTDSTYDVIMDVVSRDQRMYQNV